MSERLLITVVKFGISISSKKHENLVEELFGALSLIMFSHFTKRQDFKTFLCFYQSVLLEFWSVPRLTVVMS